ncbi:LRR domain containing protein [Trema orientale]|uniref:LRR domain containing protein n=1 Tax=Trema orientale TaxID=63057 RepID=A0A2P5F3N6_TREOI|nr:LRR domain containing protein [Trema orientale]
MHHDRTVEYNTLDSFRGMRVQKGIGCLENLNILAVVDAHCSGANLIKELEKLRQLRWLTISKLTKENERALCVSIQIMNHLERLNLVSISTDEILELQSILSPPPFLYHVVLRSRLQSFPSWITKLQKLSTLGLNNTRLIEDPLNNLKGLPNLEYLWFRASI